MLVQRSDYGEADIYGKISFDSAGGDGEASSVMQLTDHELWNARGINAFSPSPFK